MRVGSEFPPPEPVADDDLEVVAGSVVVRIEGAAQLRVDSEDREVIRRNLLKAETQGLRAAGEVHVCALTGNRYGLEYPGTLEVSPLRDGDADALRAYPGKVVLNAHQFAGVWIRQGMQQRGVDHAIHGGGGSDAERHGGDSDEGEARRSEKHANRVPQIEEQILDKRKTLLAVMTLPDRPDSAKLEHGLSMRFDCGHPGANIVRRLLREMFVHLFEQAPIVAAAGYEA